MGYYSKANRISEQLAHDIQQGDFKEKLFLPSDSALAERYGTSRITMRRAIELLVENGMLVREPSRGVRQVTGTPVVVPPPEARAVNGTIAVAWFGWEDAFLLEIRSGIREYAAANNWNVRFFSDNWQHEPIIGFFDQIESHEVDGVITIPYEDECYERSLGRLQRIGFPLVCVDRTLPNLRTNSVMVDNIGGCFESTRRLLERHRKPVWFFGQRDEAASNRARYEGYVQAMREFGFGGQAKVMLIESKNLVPNPEHWTVEPALKIITDFLRAQKQFPVVIQTCNDKNAFDTYRAAAELGLKIGKDIFLAGFDDAPPAAELDPPLSTVRQPRREIGFEAARLLEKLIRREFSGTVGICLPVTLVPRASD